MANRIYIEFATNAPEVAGKVADLQKVINNIATQQQNSRGAFTSSASSAVSNSLSNLNASIGGAVGGASAKEAIEQSLKTQLESIIASKLPETIKTAAKSILANFDTQVSQFLTSEAGDINALIQSLGSMKGKGSGEARNSLKAIVEQKKNFLKKNEEFNDELEAQLSKDLGQARLLQDLERLQGDLAKMGMNTGNLSGVDSFTKVVGDLVSVSAGLNAEFALLTKYWQEIEVADSEKLQQLQQIARRAMSMASQQKTVLSSQLSRSVTENPEQFGVNLAGALGTKYGGNLTFSGDTGQVEAEAIAGVLNTKVSAAISDFISVKATSEYESLQKLLRSSEQLPDKDRQKLIQGSLGQLRARIDRDINQLTAQVEAVASIPTDNELIKKAQENLRHALRNEIARIETFFSNQTELINEAAASGLKQEVRSAVARVKALAGSSAYSAHSFEGLAGVANVTSEAASQITSNIGGFTRGYMLSTQSGRAVPTNQIMDAQNLATSSLFDAGYYKQGQSIEYYRKAIVQAQEIMAKKLEEAVHEFEKAEKDVVTDASKKSLLNSVQVGFNAMIGLLKELENDVGILSSDIGGASRQAGKTLAREKGLQAGLDYVSNPEQYPTGRFRPSTSKEPAFTAASMRATSAAELTPESLNNIAGNREQVKLAMPASRGALAEFSQMSGQILSTWMGLQFAFDMTIGKLVEFIDEANKLDRAATTVMALGKTWGNFADSLRLAAEQQQKYGGNLTDITQAMTGIIPLVVNYGLNLEKVNDISQRLAILNPMQGYEGAAIALKEFFGGNVTSLSRRFEIDRTTLNNVRQLGDQTDRLNALDDALAQMGVSSELLASRTQTSAVAFDRAAAASNNLSIMAGQMSREWFSGFAESYASWASFAQKTVLTKQEMDNAVISAERTFSIANDSFQRDIAKGAAAVDVLNLALSKTAKTELVRNFNKAIEELNKVRVANQEKPIALFTERDEAVIKQLAELSKLSGIPISLLVNSNLNENGGITLDKTPQDVMKETRSLYDYIFSGFPGIGIDTQKISNNYDIGEQRSIIESLTGGSMYSSIADSFSNPFQDRMTTGVSSSYRKAFQTVNEQAGALTPLQLQSSKELLKRGYGVDFDATMKSLLESFFASGKTTEEYNKVLLQIIELEKKLLTVKEQTTKMEATYVEDLRKYVSDFGGSSLKDELVKQLDTMTQKDAQTSQSIAAQKYLAMGGGAGLVNPDTEQAKELLKYAQEKLGVDREGLYYLSQTQSLQAQQTLEANRTLSAYNALNSQMSDTTTTLQDAVTLSMSFKKNVESIVTSSILPQLSLENQSSYYMSSLTSAVNPEDATQSLNSYLGILKQTEQRKLDAGDSQRKYHEDMQKMTRDHNEKLSKITRDGEDARNKIIKEFADKALELLALSEVGKRQSKYDFYSGLFNMQNITPEQMKAGSAKYESLYAEASGLRNKGEFSKADELLKSGSRIIQDELTYQNAVGEQKQRIKDDDKEIAELNKEIREATSFDQINSIKEKIKEIELDKGKANLRIKQLDELRKLQKDAADEELKQIRLKEDAEKKAREQKIEENKKSVDKQTADENDAFKKLQADKETSFRESLRKQQQAQILNVEQMTDLQLASTAITTAAQIAAYGGSKAQIDEALKSYNKIKAKFEQDTSPAGKAISAWFASQDTMFSSPKNPIDPFKPSTLYGNVPDYIKYTANNDLPASLNNNTMELFKLNSVSIPNLAKGITVLTNVLTNGFPERIYR